MADIKQKTTKKETVNMNMNSEITNNNANKEDIKVNRKNRSMNNTTRRNKAINMIGKGSTWDEIAGLMDLTVGYLQKIVREGYNNPTCYNRLMAKAKENAKAKKEAEKILANAKAKAEPAKAEAKVKTKEREVSVVETGFLLAKAQQATLQDFLDSHTAIVVPYFCIKELRKLRSSFTEIEEILNLYDNRRILSVNLKGRETLYVGPTMPVKDRTKGVVAAACELISFGYPVRIFTNSREIEALALLQDADIAVERVEAN